MTMKIEGSKVLWVFNGAGGRFPAGVFTAKELAERWIATHRLSGTLTAYPLDVGAYDWAVEAGLFTPKRDEHSSPEFIGTFTSASQEHFHYENGSGD